MKSLYRIIFIITLTLVAPLSINNVYAVGTNNYNESNVVRLDFEDAGDDQNCEYILGDPDDEKSVAYMLQKVFDYIKIIGPILVIVLSGFDFAKNALLQDDEAMKKASKKLTTRLICAVLLYFVPVITSFLINLINNTSYEQTCGIS